MDELKIYIQAWMSFSSSSAYLIAIRTFLFGCLKSTINLTYPRCFLSQVKSIITQAIVQVRHLGVVLGCFLTLPYPHQIQPVTSSNRFFLF